MKLEKKPTVAVEALELPGAEGSAVGEVVAAVGVVAITAGAAAGTSAFLK